MAGTGPITATGDSEFLFSGYQHVLFTTADLTVPGLIDFMTSTYPRRVMHGGHCFLAAGYTGQPSVPVTTPVHAQEQHYFQNEAEIIRAWDDSFAYWDRVIWRIPPGITWVIEVNW